MDYKKILKNQKFRFKILNMLSWVPDKAMIKMQYRIKMGRKLNLKCPKRYTEKLQWYKLYYRNPLMKQCADKYEVRKYVKSKGLENILNELYGVYDLPSQIDFDRLPNKFVLKATNGGGGNNVLLCLDKEKFNKEEAIETMNGWFKSIQRKPFGREWCYEGIKTRIICEKLIERDSRNDLPDYKFFCFNGRVEFLYVMIDYTDNHSNGKMGFFDRDFKKLPFNRTDFKIISGNIDKPKNFDKMIEYAEILAKDFPHVRVDLYNQDGVILFGELTFYNTSGYVKFSPDSADMKIGELFDINC